MRNKWFQNATRKLSVTRSCKIFVNVQAIIGASALQDANDRDLVATTKNDCASCDFAKNDLR